MTRFNVAPGPWWEDQGLADTGWHKYECDGLLVSLWEGDGVRLDPYGDGARPLIEIYRHGVGQVTIIGFRHDSVQPVRVHNWAQTSRSGSHRWALGGDDLAGEGGIVDYYRPGCMTVWPGRGGKMLGISWNPEEGEGPTPWQTDAPAAAGDESATADESDWDRLNRMLKEEAVQRGWCAEYEAFVRKFNQGSTLKLEERTKAYAGSIAVTFTFNAGRNGEAREGVNVIADVVRSALSEFEPGHLADVRVDSRFNDIPAF